MEKRRTLMLMLLSIIVYSLSAQQLVVESCVESVGDLSASTNQRKDANGEPSALLIIRCNDEVTAVEGNLVGNIINKGYDKWAYLTGGTKQVRLSFAKHITKDIHFMDYQISSLQSNRTYILTLAESQGEVKVDAGSQYLVMSVNPKNSSVHIDDNLVMLDADGTLQTRLPYGEHSYKVEAAGYSTKSGTVTIGHEKVPLSINLISIMANVNVSCETLQSSLYVNDVFRGTEKWSGSLLPGAYIIEARREGYRSQSQNVNLSEKENRDIKFPALSAITGQLNVSYKPTNAEVYIDGTKVGTSPDIFRDIMVGNHSVEIRKSGYESANLNVTVKENAVSDLTGSLKQSVVATTSSSTSGSSLGGYSSSSSSSSSTSSVLPITVKGVTFKMVKVDGGTFTMGATSEQGSDAYKDEKPVHQVTLSSYYIGETEVTQALWTAVMGSNPSYFKGENKPVEQVSWNDCQEFISRLNSQTGKHFSLPTEAQWEYAARGGRKSQGNKYSGSGDIGNVAWYGYSSGGTHDVAAKSPNELGIYDMSGNVYEWCSDWYGSYSSDSQTNPTGADNGSYRVRRGGSWNYDAWYCRVSNRRDNTPDYRYRYIGLRLALVVLLSFEEASPYF